MNFYWLKLMICKIKDPIYTIITTLSHSFLTPNRKSTLRSKVVQSEVKKRTDVIRVGVIEQGREGTRVKWKRN